MGHEHRLITIVCAFLVTLVMAPPYLLALAEQNVSGAVITNGAKVSMELTVKLPDDKIVFSNVGQEPLVYVHGRGEVIPGLERALSGMGPGQRTSVSLKPEDAFGHYDESKKRIIGRDQVPVSGKVGDTIRFEDGKTARITDISDSTVTVDFNHPLVGLDVVIDVKVLDVERP